MLVLKAHLTLTKEAMGMPFSACLSGEKHDKSTFWGAFPRAGFGVHIVHLPLISLDGSWLHRPPIVRPRDCDGKLAACTGLLNLSASLWRILPIHCDPWLSPDQVVLQEDFLRNWIYQIYHAGWNHLAFLGLCNENGTITDPQLFIWDILDYSLPKDSVRGWICPNVSFPLEKHYFVSVHLNHSISRNMQWPIWWFWKENLSTLAQALPFRMSCL